MRSLLSQQSGPIVADDPYAVPAPGPPDPTLAPGRTEQRRRNLALVCAVGREYGLPLRAWLTLVLAESDLREDAINPTDGPYGSIGLCQQRIDLAPEFALGIGADQVRSLYTNAGYALRQAAPRYQQWLIQENENAVYACLRWNAPALDPAARVRKQDSQSWNYQQSWEKAARILASQEAGY